MEAVVAALFLVMLHILCALLYIVLPCKETVGYVCDRDGKPLSYRLNGLRTYFAILSLFVLGTKLTLLSSTLLVDQFWVVVGVSNFLGLVGSAAAYFIPKYIATSLQEPTRRAITIDMMQRQQFSSNNYHRTSPKTGRDTTVSSEPRNTPSRLPLVNVMLEFYSGLQFNPRLGNLDLKMYSYLYGAVLLELVLLNAAASHIEITGSLSNAMCVYVGMFSWFVTEYIYFENVHLYTYDLFAEKFGFKLLWGCWVFYPLFYPIGVWPLITTSRDLTNGQIILIITTFFLGWFLTRGANLQKYFAKRDISKTFLGIKQETIKETPILISGFWGFARHINYFGEILQGIALALPSWLLTGSLIPWLYPLYYVLLLIPRQWEDDRICARKYGVSWIEYTTRVPYRVIPFVY
eukprot:gene780-4068_t